MKSLKAENNLVIILFLMVLVTFSFAEKDSKKMEQIYTQLQQKNSMLSSAPKMSQQPYPSTYLAGTNPTR